MIFKYFIARQFTVYPTQIRLLINTPATPLSDQIQS